MAKRNWMGQSLHDMFSALGLSVAKRQPPHWAEFTLLRQYLEDHKITQVLDVGANEGQFASKLFDVGYAGSIVSFEPMPNEHEVLSRNAASNPRWIVPPPVALSDRSGSAEFHVAGNSISSSLLPMEQLHVTHAPLSAETKKIEVRLARLDELLPSILPTGKVLLKIDTQGTERDVLDGSSGVLDRIVGIKTELSFVSLYTGQPLFGEMFEHITGLGFDIYHFVHGFRGRARARLLQCDGLFFRKKSQ